MQRIAWLLAMVVLLAGCAPAGPQDGGPVTQPKDPAAVYATMRPPLQYAAEDEVAARQIEFIAVRRFDTNTGYVGLNRPLWGDQNEQEIAHVLALLRQRGVPGTGCTVHNLLLIRPKYGAERCYDLAEVFGDQNWRGLLPPIAPVVADPSTAAPGEPITVHGEGWVGGENTVTLELRDGNGTAFRLGEAPLQRGNFTWTGPLPVGGVTIPPWHHVTLLATVAGVGTAYGDLSLSLKR